MEVYFNENALDRLEIDKSYTAGLPPAVVSLYRKRLAHLRAARDERDLLAMRCLQVVLLGTHPGNHYSIGLDDQYDLLIEVRTNSDPRSVQLIAIQPRGRGRD